MSDQQEKVEFYESLIMAQKEPMSSETLRQLLARDADGHTIARRVIANAKARAHGKKMIGKPTYWRSSSTVLVAQLLKITPKRAAMLVSEMCEDKIYV